MPSTCSICGRDYFKGLCPHVALRGRIYTFLEICESLDLWDSPHLNFVNSKGEKDTVQTAHMTPEQHLLLPGWEKTKWKYLFRTHEWCEIFQACDDKEIQELTEYYDSGYGDILSRPKQQE